jgi:hypothetical protein
MICITPRVIMCTMPNEYTAISYEHIETVIHLFQLTVIFIVWCRKAKLKTHLSYLTFQPFDFERSWWGLSLKRVVHTKLDIYVLIRLLPIHHDDHHLLGSTWEGKYYYDTCLPVGCSSSCQLLQTFSTDLHWIEEKKLFRIAGIISPSMLFLFHW